MIAVRSRNIDSLMEGYQRRTGNEFYNNPVYRDPLQEFVNDMKILIDKNGFMEKSFSELQTDVMKVSNITHFFDHVEEIDNIVGLKGR